MARRDFYEVLGVDRKASADEIQRAYRKLARTYHPDVNKDPGAEDRFKEISEAYDILSDPDLRKRYDAFGHDFRQVPDGMAAHDAEYSARGRRVQDPGKRPKGAANQRPSIRPMISFMIWVEPPPIGPSRASRHARCTGNSIMYP